MPSTESQAVALCIFFLIDTTNVNAYILHVNSRVSLNLALCTHLEFLQILGMDLADTTSNGTTTQNIQGIQQTNIHFPLHGGRRCICVYCKLKRTIYVCKPCGNQTICMGECSRRPPHEIVQSVVMNDIHIVGIHCLQNQ